MKRIFYLFTLTLLGLNFAHSQDLTTLTQEGRQWSIELEWCVWPIWDFTEIYTMEGDTTLNDKSYKKIYYYHTRDLLDRKLYPSYACRQEGKKVFAYFYEEQKEKLFFDFSLKVGDTFSVEENYCNMMVTAVGDTTINGRASRYLRLVNRDTYNLASEDIWVEGIGSLYYGINWDGMYQMFGAQVHTLLCCHDGGDLLWKKSDDGECFVGAPGQDDVKQNSPWFPKWAIWFYGLTDDKEDCLVDLSMVKDTLFAGRMCKQLKLDDWRYGTLYEYVYPCGDSLFYYNYAAKKFFLLLDLSAKIGDTVRVHNTEFKLNPGFDPYKLWLTQNEFDTYPFMAYKIVALDTMKVGDLSLRRQKVEPVVSRRVNGKTETSGWAFPSSFQDQNYIVERIGSLGGFFGEKMSNTQESGHYKLRCFFAGSSNGNRGNTYLTDGLCFTRNKCNKEVVWTAVESTWVLNSAQWQLSPQPSGETVQAVCVDAMSAWQKGRWYLHDLTGKRLQSGVFTDGRFEVSLHSV